MEPQRTCVVGAGLVPALPVGMADVRAPTRGAPTKRHRFTETLERRRFSAPVLRPVPDVQDFNNFFRATVYNDVRRTHEFAGSFYLSGSAKAGESCQLFNAGDKRLRDIPGCGGVVLLDAFDSGFKLVGGFGCPANQSHE